jgi:hypothetical protein
MFYEEKSINGILCHRNSPDGEWIQFTLEALTTVFIAMRGVARNSEIRAETAEIKLNRVKSLF